MNIQTNFKWIALSCLLGSIPSCATLEPEIPLTRIHLTEQASQRRLSDVFQVEGFVKIAADQSNKVRSVDKLLFTRDKMIVLDNFTDFDHIWVIDPKSGAFLGEIGSEGDAENQYKGLNDICLTPKGDKIICSAAGKMSFVQYDLSGKWEKTMVNGTYGEELEVSDAGDFIIYNEYNATEVTGYNHLLFYDNQGNLVKRAAPYNPETDGNGFMMTGFLSRVGEQIWFNPPFSDTLFSVTGKRLQPQFVFDFNGHKVPEQLRNGKKIAGPEVENYAFIGENLFINDRYLLFNLFQDKRITRGLFDVQKGEYLNFRAAQKDYLYELIQGEQLFPKDKNSIACVITPWRLQYLYEKNLIDREQMQQHQPALLEALDELIAHPDSGPLVLYLSLNSNMAF